MSNKKSTITVVLPKTTKKKNKTRSKGPQASSQKLGQQQIIRAPISQSRVTGTNNRKIVRQFHFPRRQELIGLVTLTETFSTTQFPINPGSTGFSTWLQNIANCFESYKFHYLSFHYIPRCPSTTGGSVYLIPDPNPRDPAPTSAIEACQNDRAKSASPWMEFSIVFSKEMLEKRKSYFCRKFDQLPGGADRDLYDVGNLFTGQDCPVALANAGQLWVEYEVEFFNPEHAVGATPQTDFLRQATGLTNVSPILGSSATLVKEATGDSIYSITNDGTQDIITFAKDFHGILNMKMNGVGLTQPNITGLLGGQVNVVEAGFNIANSLVNSTATFNSLSSLIDMKAGQALSLKLPSATSIASSVLTLSKCFL